MYKIFADKVLIYDSTIDDYHIGKGQISLEINKSGSFVFSVYPDHFFYDSFVRLKTVITVYKSGRIVFRGRILNDVTDYWNNKVLTCEGELGFLQDTIVRPFSFTGTPEEFLRQMINNHNAGVDDFKKFKVGTVTVIDSNNYIARSNTGYQNTLTSLDEQLINSALGGNFLITHGEDGTDPIPTIHYLADYTKVSTQVIEFGSNLKNYTKTVKAEDIATAIVPLGAKPEGSTDEPPLTIASVNGGVDYIHSPEAVALYGWIFKTVEWSDVTVAANLKKKAEAYLEEIVKQNVTIELTAIDLHLIDPTIESINVCDYVRVISAPHNFDATFLCSKQTIDLLKPENDSFVLGHTYATFTEASSKTASQVSMIGGVQKSVDHLSNTVTVLNQNVTDTDKTTKEILAEHELRFKQLEELDLSMYAKTLEDHETRIKTLEELDRLEYSEVANEAGGTTAIID